MYPLCVSSHIIADFTGYFECMSVVVLTLTAIQCTHNILTKLILDYCMLLTLNGHHTANEEGHEPQSNFLLISEELSSLRAIPILLTVFFLFFCFLVRL